VAWISYLRWVVLIDWYFVWWCSAGRAVVLMPAPILAARHRPAHAVGRVALPRTSR